jgi:hypothetical protein
MEKYMTVNEYIELLKYIHKNHNFALCQGKAIKYVDCTFDNRFGQIFSIRFRGFGNKEIVFSIVNENRDNNLKEWIYEWLESENR